MIPLDKQRTTYRMQPSSAFNLTQLKFESANSSDSSESNMVWIILFSLLIFISVLSNSLYILYNIRRRCVTHTILSVFFLLNLLDYVLLIIEFSSEHPGQFSHSEAWCSLYQLLLQTAPLLTSITIVFLLYQAWGLRCLSSTPALLTLVISTTTLFSNMGGLLGLCMGFSVVSLAELLHCVVTIISEYTKRMWKTIT